MGYDVTEIRFDEVYLEIEPGFYGLPFYGSAQIDTDGAVVSIGIDGFKNGEQVTQYFDVPSKYTTNVTRNGEMLRRMAAAIQRHCQDGIEEALADWREAASVREFEPAE